MEQNVSTARIALKNGIITGIVMMLLTTVINTTAQFTNTWLSSLIYLILIVGIVLSMREFKSLNGGFMTYGQGLGLGTLTIAVGGFLSVVFSLIYSQFIDTTVQAQMLEQMREKFEQQGMDDAMVDMMLEQSEKFMSPGLQFGIGMLTMVILGFIFSLVVAAFLRKNKPVFE